MRFVDTNVLIYAASLDPAESDKRLRALDLLAQDELIVSIQVLQEFYVQSTRSSRRGALTHEEALSFIETLDRFSPVDMTLDVFRAALAIRERFGLSYWDGAILAAARISGCDIVYSEDMSHEQDYDGVRVVNPFADEGA
jgi:predicted nucleic acid-binding protein